MAKHIKKTEHGAVKKPVNPAGKTRMFLFAAVFGAVGAILLLISHAATPVNNTIEPETGTINNYAAPGDDTAASNSKYVGFNGPSTCPAGTTGTPPTCTVPLSTTTLPPGSVLPDDATCAARVVKAVETRPQNATQNASAGKNKGLSGTFKARVDGSFTGTTDEIIQWVACKWGINSDIVRAQAAKESYWTMSAKGDWTTDVNSCPHGTGIANHGLGVDDPTNHPNECPESYSIIQDRWNYLGPPAGLNTWPEVENSTAYALDLAYSSWRDCFEGNYGWLNTVDHTGTYAAGDDWGCVGVWFAGRWKTDPATTYISAVQDYYTQKIWTTSSFISYR